LLDRGVEAILPGVQPPERDIGFETSGIELDGGTKLLFRPGGVGPRGRDRPG
jgi:hypothetical protein